MIPRIPVEDEDEEAARPTPLWRRPKFILVAAIGVVVIIYVFNRGQEPTKHANGQKATDTFIDEVVGYQPPAKITPSAHAEAASAPAPAPAAPTPTVATAPSPPQPSVVTQDVPRPPAAPSLRTMLPPQVFAQQTQTRTRMLVYAVPPVAPPAAPQPDLATGLDFKTSSIPGLKASASIDDTYQLMPGLLPLVLDTAINSDVPGPIMAHLPGPVYSPKGVLLMEAGTQIIGKYEAMGKGSRLMAGSLYAHTPHGIWVPLTAQGMADELGRSGLPGNVDHHYLERFGFATLLTITDQASQIIQAEVSKGGNSYINLNGGGGGIGSLAQQILQAQINIPPTFTKNQGEMMALFLDQPIDFSASYRVHTVKE